MSLRRRRRPCERRRRRPPPSRPSGSPSFFDHSALRIPAGVSEVQVRRKSRSRSPASRGSSRVRNSCEGRPSNSSCHIALCPAAQRLRFRVSGSVFPVRRAGIQSQCSTQEKAAFRTYSSSRRMWRIFAQNHSEEYIPPSYRVKSVPPQLRATRLISSASRTAV